MVQRGQGEAIGGREDQEQEGRKAPYPKVGIRIRPGMENPLTKRRERADPSAFIDPDARMYANSLLTSGQSTLHISTPAPTTMNHHMACQNLR